jgi:ABC-2 type transport system ATP-binding protein
LCDRVAIIDHGRIMALDTPTALIRSLGREERVVFSGDQSLPAGFETSLPHSVRLDVKDDRVTVRCINGRGTPLVSEVVNRLGELGVKFRDLRTEQPNLEDVFLGLTGRDMRS